jgi:hypothetical protein
MESLKLYLTKFRGILPVDGLVKQAVLAAVAKHAGVKLKTTDIQVTNQVIYLKTRPTIKSEIFLRREAISEEISTLLSQTTKRRIV